MAHAHAKSDLFEDDPELRESVRVLRHQHSMRLIGVVVAMIAAFGTAALYALLSYSGR